MMISHENLCDHDQYVGYCKACQILTFKLSKDPKVWLPNDVWKIIKDELPNTYEFNIRLMATMDVDKIVEYQRMWIMTDNLMEHFLSLENEDHAYRIIFVGSELSLLGFIFNLYLFGYQGYTMAKYGTDCEDVRMILDNILDIVKYKPERDLEKFFFYNKRLLGNTYKDALIIRLPQKTERYTPSAKFNLKLSEVNEFILGWQQYDNMNLRFSSEEFPTDVDEPLQYQYATNIYREEIQNRDLHWSLQDNGETLQFTINLQEYINISECLGIFNPRVFFMRIK